MESPFMNDPFAMIYQAFKNLYPDKRFEAWLVPEKPAGEEGYGYTTFPDDGGVPCIVVYADAPFEAQTEVFAHELAHVAAGPDADHGEEWERAFTNIQIEYNRLGECMMKENSTDKISSSEIPNY